MRFINMKIFGFVLTVLTLIGFNSLFAQENLEKPIPVDPKVRVGKLDNGITYYIRENAKPENRAELRLVVDAGSILEDDDQQGLAHFMEHMAFNGTKNFKKNELIDYLQSVGVKFGAHLNAYTSFDETVYMLRVPTDSAEVMNTGFQILEDWAHQVTLDEEQIDTERGVVIEEWRRGLGASERMRQEWFPVAYEDSRYAERLPIGKKDVLDNFSYETLEKFYEDWYRPDLMAVIVVGDIDPDEMESKIKEQFSKVPEAEEKRERKEYSVPILNKNTVTVASDPENSFTQIRIMYKKERKPFKTLADYRRKLVYRAFTGMLTNRFSELRESANPPFMFSSASYSKSLGNIDQYSFFAMVGAEGVERGLRTMMEEQQRVKQHGFIKSELERYKKEVLRRYEKAYKERDKAESRRYAREYVSLFLDDSPSPGIAFEYDFIKKQLPTITLEEVNGLIDELVRDENRSVIVTAAEKEGVELPTEEELESLIQSVKKQAEIEPYTEDEIAEELMAEKPEPGKIVEEKKHEEISATRLTLSNGVEVVLKPTDFKNDEILFSGRSPGGHSLYDNETYKSASYASRIIGESGLGEFSSSDLRKYMADKNAQVSPYISSLSEGFRGNCSPEDLETMLQMANMYFTDIRADKDAFKSMKAKNTMMFQNLMANPGFYFSDQVSKLLTQNHPRGGGFPTPEDMEAIDFDTAMEVYRERFADAGDFTFYLVGNFEVEEIKPMLEQYLGSLPSKNREETWKDLGIRPPEGMVEKSIRKGTEPKSTVRLIFTGETKYDPEKAYHLSSLGELLSIKLIEQLREEKSGVYSIGARGSMSKYPYGKYKFTISFPCNPENVESLIEAALAEIGKVQKNGPKEKDLKKVKEGQRRDHELDVKKNRFWLRYLRSTDYYGRDPERITEFEEKLEGLSAKDLKKAAKKYLDTDAYIKAVLLPEESE